MFIPTQEERYSKRTLMTLILCVMAPAGVYAYFFIADKLNIPMDSLAGILNLMLVFTYPLAFVFIELGVPALSWGGLNWGGMLCSLLVHLVLVTMLYMSRVSPKMAITLAIVLGFMDLLAIKLIGVS